MSAVKAGVITIDLVGRSTILQTEADKAAAKLASLGTTATRTGRVVYASMVEGGRGVRLLAAANDDGGNALVRYTHRLEDSGRAVKKFAKDHEAAVIAGGNALVVYANKVDQTARSVEHLMSIGAKAATSTAAGVSIARLIDTERTQSSIAKVVDAYKAARLAYAGYISYVTGSFSTLAAASAYMLAAAAAAGAVRLAYNRSDQIRQQSFFSAQSGISFENVDQIDRLGLKSGLNTRGYYQQLQSQYSSNPQGVNQALGSLGATKSVGDPKVLAEIAKGFIAIKDPVEQAQIATVLFGEQGSKAVDELNASFVKAAKAVDDISVPMDKWSRVKIKEFHDDMDVAKEDLISFGETMKMVGEVVLTGGLYVGLEKLDKLASTGALKTYIAEYTAGTWDMLKEGERTLTALLIKAHELAGIASPFGQPGATLKGIELYQSRNFVAPPLTAPAPPDRTGYVQGDIVEFQQARKRESETIEGQRRAAEAAQARSESAYAKLQADDAAREQLKIARGARPDLNIPEPAGMLSSAQRDLLAQEAMTASLLAKVTNDHVRAMELAKSTTELLSDKLHGLTMEMQHSAVSSAEAGASERKKRELEAEQVVQNTRVELAKKQIASTTKAGEPVLAPTAEQIAGAMNPEDAASLKAAAMAELEMRDATAAHVRSIEAARSITELLDERFFSLNREMGNTAVQIDAVGKTEEERRRVEAELSLDALRLEVARKQVAAATPPGQVVPQPSAGQIANAIPSPIADRLREAMVANLATTAEKSWRTELDRTIDSLLRRIAVQTILTDSIGKTADETDRARVETELMNEFGKTYQNPTTEQASAIDRARQLKLTAARVGRSADVVKTNDSLSKEIELEKSLAAVQKQGKDAVDLVTLAYKLRALSAAGLSGEISKEIELNNAKKANADAEWTRTETESQQDAIDKLDLEISGERKLAAAQLQGAEAVRKQMLENKLELLDYESAATDVFDKLSARTKLLEETKNKASILKDAIATSAAFSDHIAKLRDELSIVEGLEAGNRQTRDLEMDRLRIEKELAETSSKQALATGTLMGGLKAFITEADVQAAKPGQILYDGLNRTVDTLSGSIAKAATGDVKHADFGKGLHNVGESMVQSVAKSALQKGAGAIGKKLGLNLGHKDGQSPTSAFWVQMAIDKGNALGKMLAGRGAPINMPAPPVLLPGRSAPSIPGSTGAIVGSAGAAGGGTSVTSTLSFPSYAEGGYAAAGTAYWGDENGPELHVAGPMGNTVVPVDRMGSGVSISMPIDARGADIGMLGRLDQAMDKMHSSAVSLAVSAAKEKSRRVPSGGHN